MPKLEMFTSSEFLANTYVIHTDILSLCVDPAVEEALKPLQRGKRAVLLATHGHFDHIYRASLWAKTLSTSLLVHPSDVNMVREPLLNVSAYFGDEVSYTGEVLLVEEGRFPFSDIEAEVWHLPGHSPGSIGLFFEKEKWFFGGDLLFASSVGRTDLPGGNETLLHQSVARVLALPDDVVVYPGHEEIFTVGDFRREYRKWGPS